MKNRRRGERPISRHESRRGFAAAFAYFVNLPDRSQTRFIDAVQRLAGVLYLPASGV